MISFSCPACGHVIKAPDDAVGKTGKCKCGERVRVPSPRSSITAEKPSCPRPIPAPSSFPDASPELPKWLANAFPNASPAVLKSLYENWRDAQQHQGDRSTPTSQSATAASPPSPAAVGDSLPQHSTPATDYYVSSATRSGAVGVPLPQRPTPALALAPASKYPDPTGEMILCYACRKPLADTANACPKCGAIQTAEGREKGRQMKKHEQRFVLIVTLVIALPLFFCCIGSMSNSPSSSPPPAQRGPAGWDMDKLKRDADEVARDPSKTIFVPKDGSQPFWTSP